MTRLPVLLAALALVAVVALGCWSLWSPVASPGIGGPGSGPGGSAAGSPSAAAAVALAAGGSAAGGPAAPQRIEREEDETVPSSGPGAGLPLFVQHSDGAPAVGVRVRWLTETALRPMRSSVLHPATAVDLRGPGATTDAEGRVFLPPDQRRLHVAAQHDTSYGYFAISTESRTREGRPDLILRLQPDSLVRIAVVDASGAPAAAIPLTLEQGRDRGWRRAVSTETDAEGIAAIPHTQLHGRPARGGDRNSYRVRLGIPVRVPGGEAFPLPYRGDVRIALPPTSPLTVQVFGPGGQSFATPAQVSLSVAPPPDAEPEGRNRRRGAERFSLPMAAWTGRVEFPHVETGMTWVPDVRPRDNDLAWSGEPFVGPIAAGRALTVDVPPPPWMGAIAGRLLVGGQGAPERDVELLLTGGLGRIEGERVETDADGRFELPYRAGDSTVPVFMLQASLRRFDPPTGGLAAVRSAGAGIRSDIGDLELAAMPAFVTGLVVDDRGLPVAGASVELLRLRGSGDRASWGADPGVRTNTAEDGTFELHATPAPGRLLVQARARSHRNARSSELAAGAEVRLMLQRTGTLSAASEVPRWLTQSALDLQIVADATGQRIPARLRVGGGRLSFRTRELDPGSYSVRILLTGFESPLFERGSIWVEPGDQVLDPPMPDLRDAVFRYSFRSASSTGQVMRDPRSPLIVRRTLLDGSEQVVGFPWAGRRVDVFSASPSMTVTWMGQGYRPTSGTFTPGVHQLVFDALQPVLLTVHGARQLVGPGRRVRVSMVYVGETGLPSGMQTRDQASGSRRGYSRAELSKSGGAWLGEDGDDVEMALMLDGDYDVVLRIHGDGRRPQSHVVGRVAVQLSAARPCRVAVTADPAKVQAALDALAEPAVENGR